LFTFYSAASFLSLFGIIAVHKKLTNTECKTMYYLVVWAVLFVIASFIFIPDEVGTGMAVFFVGLGQGVATAAVAVGHALLWIVSIVWLGLKIALSWKPIDVLLLPWWGYIVLLTVFGWVTDKFCTRYGEKQTAYIREHNPQELLKINRSAWIEVFAQVLMTHPTWKSGWVLMNRIDDEFIGKAAAQYRYSLIRDAFEIYWKNDLDKLQTSYPEVPKGVIDFIKKDEARWADDRFYLLRQHLLEKHDTFPVMDVDDFIKVLLKIAESNAGVKTLASYYKDLANRKAEKELARQNSWSHKTCLKVTTAIATSVHQTGRGIKTAAVQVATLSAYLWMLIKAKKQGACPYFTFAEPVKPVAPTVPTNTDPSESPKKKRKNKKK
jgi:hypothetical protein